MTLVTDASVVAKWFLPEEHSEAAVLLLRETEPLIAPAHFDAEIANIFWKRVRMGHLQPEQALRTLAGLPGVVDSSFGLPGLVRPAFDFAVRFDRTIYDSLYVALAVQEGCQFVTADRRSYNGLRDAFPQTMVWVADLTATEGD